MRISCKKCGQRLSNDVAIAADGVRSETDGSDYIPLGLAYLEDGDFWPKHRGSWCLNSRDATNLVRTSNPGRLNGCCDLDGLDGPNMVCTGCGKEVATAKLDCWMPHAVIFEPGYVNVAT